MHDLCLELALELREIVLPALGSHAARAHEDVAAVGGDVTFAIDAEAEAFVERFLAGRGIASYTEARGLVAPDGATEILIVDPIDGTRPAVAGLEAACVSIAAARLPEPTMADVTVGVVVELKTGQRFSAERGAGVQADQPVAPSPNTDLDRLFWTYGLRGRPARPLMTVIGELVDRSSVGGGTFELGGAAYDMTRVLTGQLDAYVEAGPLLVEEVDGMLEEFRRVGRGAVLNNSPYDVAAGALLLTEGGAVLTDCAGRSLDDRPLLGSGVEYQMSILAAGNAELHAALVREVAHGIGRLRDSV
jgi:myo-inositol-1(or 4)-monophosphatase